MKTVGCGSDAPARTRASGLDRIHQRRGTRRIADHAAEQARVAGELLDAVDLERDRRDAGLAQAIECRPVVVARIENHEVRLGRDERLDIWTKRLPETRNRDRRIRKDIPLRPPDEPIRRAKREQDLRGRRIQRETPRRTVEVDTLAKSSRTSDAQPVARRRGGTPCHDDRGKGDGARGMGCSLSLVRGEKLRQLALDGTAGVVGGA